MPCASFSMLDGPGGIHIIVQDQDGENNNIEQNEITIIVHFICFLSANQDSITYVNPFHYNTQI